MVINQKPTGRASSIQAGLVFGAVISLSATMLAAVVLAKLIESEKMPWESVGYGILALLLISSFLGSVSAYSKIKRQRLMVCLLSGFIYFGILLSITALFFGGQYEAVGETAALVFAGSGTAGLLGLKEKRGGKRKIGRQRYR